MSVSCFEQLLTKNISVIQFEVTFSPLEQLQVYACFFSFQIIIGTTLYS